MMYWQYNRETDSYKCRRSGAIAPADSFRPAFPTDVQIDAHISRTLEFWTFNRGTNYWERLDGKTLSGACVLANPSPMLFLTDHYLDYLLAKGESVPVTVEIAEAANKLGQAFYNMQLARQNLTAARDRKRALLCAAERDGESDIKLATQTWDDINEVWLKVKTEYFDLVNKKTQGPA